MDARKARATLHLARPEDAIPLVEITRYEGESDEHFEKRRTAIRALGVNWLRHPHYRFNALHSTNADIWKPAHLEWWAQVHVAAMKARETNPAFIRAREVRNVIGGA
jgi:hypothetical protein